MPTASFELWASKRDTKELMMKEEEKMEREMKKKDWFLLLLLVWGSCLEEEVRAS